MMMKWETHSHLKNKMLMIYVGIGGVFGFAFLFSFVCVYLRLIYDVTVILSNISNKWETKYFIKHIWNYSKGLKARKIPTSISAVPGILRTCVCGLLIHFYKTCLPCLQNQNIDKLLENLKSKMMFFGGQRKRKPCSKFWMERGSGVFIYKMVLYFY